MAFAPATPPEERITLLHAARSAVAALASLLVARAFKMPEPYWAAVTTMVVMQSSLGAALTVSGKRFAGTALGAIVGGLLGSYFGPSAIVFAAAVFGMGLLCAALRLDKTAYRFAGITLAIVMLVVRNQSAWTIAAHRFIEVSLGIVVALILTAVWPEPQPQTGKPIETHQKT